MGDHRWQGYRHAELYEQIHEGPGPDTSATSVHRWRELTRALDEIDDGLATATTAAAREWQGLAADSAHSGLRPLRDWAASAGHAADVMRERARQQAEFIEKARRDMPPPVQMTSENPGTAVSALTHLFGGQTDYEAQEAAQDDAEQRAFDVMRTYETSTRANVTELADFAPPPQVAVDVPDTGPPGTGTGPTQVTISWGTPDASTPPTTPVSRAPADARSPDQHLESDGPVRSVDRAKRDDAPADSPVTEQLGRQGGFFDEPQTLARPVIGGEPGR